MIELVGLMLAAWNYTSVTPSVHQDVVTEKLVVDLNRFHVLTQRQIAAVCSMTAPTVKAILIRHREVSVPGIKGALNPKALSLVLAVTKLQALSQLQAVSHPPDHDMVAIMAKSAGDPTILSKLTGLSAYAIRKAGRCEYNHPHPHNDTDSGLLGAPERLVLASPDPGFD